jgi:DnaK suppressor protein
MKKQEMKKFEKLLLAERTHLSAGIRQIEENTLEDSDRDTSGDLTSFAEAGTDNNERETALRVASGESEWLGDVDDALVRIKDGTFGVCEGCEDDIPVKRLEVYPSARFCVTCQSKMESEGSL